MDPNMTRRDYRVGHDNEDEAPRPTRPSKERRLGVVIGAIALVGLGAWVADRVGGDDSPLAIGTTDVPLVAGPPSTTGVGAAVARRQSVTAIKRSIRDHWMAQAKDSDAALVGAYRFFSGPQQAKQSQAAWIRSIRAGGATTVVIHRISVGKITGSGVAPATVDVTTERAVGGCTRQVVRYRMARQQGAWRATRATAIPRAC